MICVTSWQTTLLSSVTTRPSKAHSLSISSPAQPGPGFERSTLFHPAFLTYLAVRTTDPLTRDQLTYARLLVRESLRHGGQGWLEYDRLFRQQVAIDQSLRWNTIHSGLQATTILGQRSGGGMACSICQECDHTPSQCATAHIQQPVCPQAAGHRAGRHYLDGQVGNYRCACHGTRGRRVPRYLYLSPCLFHLQPPLSRGRVSPISGMPFIFRCFTYSNGLCFINSWN